MGARNSCSRKQVTAANGTGSTEPRGLLCALGIHGQWIYIHPDAELVIVRMASEATPLDFDYVRGWRRGFDAIAAHFL